jgi:hypothetical protein
MIRVGKQQTRKAKRQGKEEKPKRSRESQGRKKKRALVERKEQPRGIREERGNEKERDDGNDRRFQKLATSSKRSRPWPSRPRPG